MPTHNLEDQPESASEVADDILTNGFENHDFLAWDTFDSFYESEMLADIIATIATFQYSSSLTMDKNRIERLAQIEDCIRKHLIAAAKREGYVDPLMSNDPNDY